MNLGQDIEVFTEVFPVRTAAIPKLSAYRLDVTGGDVSTVGGKLSYRLGRTFQGHWVWTNGKILTDTHPYTSRSFRLAIESPHP